MPVYVDDMRNQHLHMKMCHMLADSDGELHGMADRLGLKRSWHQAPPMHDSHYDIAQIKRAAAVAAGAIEITRRQAAAMILRRRVTGALGSPSDALTWFAAYRVGRRCGLEEGALSRRQA